MTFEDFTREFARFTEEYNRFQKSIKNSIKDSLEASRKMEFSGVSGTVPPSSMADLVSVERWDYAGEVCLLFLVKTRYTNEFNHWLITSHPKPKLIESGSGDFTDMYLVAIYHSSDINEYLSYLNLELAKMIFRCDRVNVSEMIFRCDRVNVSEKHQDSKVGRVAEKDCMDMHSLTGMCFAPMTPVMSGKKLNGGVETITGNPSQRRSFWELLKESIGFKKKMKKPESNDIKEYRPE